MSARPDQVRRGIDPQPLGYKRGAAVTVLSLLAFVVPGRQRFAAAVDVCGEATRSQASRNESLWLWQPRSSLNQSCWAERYFFSSDQCSKAFADLRNFSGLVKTAGLTEAVKEYHLDVTFLDILLETPPDAFQSAYVTVWFASLVLRLPRQAFLLIRATGHIVRLINDSALGRRGEDLQLAMQRGRNWLLIGFGSLAAVMGSLVALGAVV